MATKKNIKVRDLKPSKDAKGGGSHPAPQGTKPQGTLAAGGSSTAGTKPSHGHHHAIN